MAVAGASEPEGLRTTEGASGLEEGLRTGADPLELRTVAAAAFRTEAVADTEVVAWRIRAADTASAWVANIASGSHLAPCRVVASSVVDTWATGKPSASTP